MIYVGALAFFAYLVIKEWVREHSRRCGDAAFVRILTETYARSCREQADR